jgi:hypothetical protein
MRNKIWALLIVLDALFLSCAGHASALRPEMPPVQPPVLYEAPLVEAPTIRAAPPVERILPPVPSAILGTGHMTVEELAAFLLAAHSSADAAFVRELAAFYIEEAAIEQVNHDVAFSQMCLETGFLKYGNLVTPDMNNFCGLGAIGPGQPGERFPDARTGVRAHIQHLKAYASEEPPVQPLVDPRYRWVKYGTAPTIDGLALRWAADPLYGEKIALLLERLYTLGRSDEEQEDGGDEEDEGLAESD